MERREVKVSEFVKEIAKISNTSNVIMTGVSGSGKDWLNAKLAKPLFPLDSIGAKKNDKWVIDPSKIPDSANGSVMGWSDNLGEVADSIREEWEGDLVLVWIQPSAEIFKLAQAAKAKDATEKDSSWKKDWAAKAKWSAAKVKTYLDGKLKLVTAKVRPDQLIIVENSSREGAITVGWHQTKGGQDAKS